MPTRLLYPNLGKNWRRGDARGRRSKHAVGMIGFYLRPIWRAAAVCDIARGWGLGCHSSAVSLVPTDLVHPRVQCVDCVLKV